MSVDHSEGARSDPDYTLEKQTTVRPSFHDSVRRAWQWPPFRYSLILFVALRIGLSVWAILTMSIVQAETGPDPMIRPYYDVEPVDEGLGGWLLGPWQRFDTLHYTHIAIYGYEPGTSHTVFPPLYPLLIRVVGGLLGGSYLLAALLISNLSALGYFIVFFLLAEEAIGWRAARHAQVFAAIYPWSFVLLAGYTEPLFLLFASLAFWAARRGRGWAAGLCGALASLTRLQGGILGAPLLLEAVQQRKFKLWPIRMDLVWPFLPPLASIGFLVGRELVGIEPIFMTYATQWHHASAPPWVGMITNFRNMLAGSAHPVDYLDMAAAWFAIVLTVIAWKKLRPMYALYMTLAVLFNTAHLRDPNPMVSVGRHTVELFPAFFILGQVMMKRPRRGRVILLIMFTLYLAVSGMFVLWGWVG